MACWLSTSWRIRTFVWEVCSRLVIHIFTSVSLISVSVTGRLKGQKCVNTTDFGQVQVRADNELCLRVIGGQESRAPLSNSTNHPSLFLRLKLKMNSEKFCHVVYHLCLYPYFPHSNWTLYNLINYQRSVQIQRVSIHSMKTRMKWDQDQTVQGDG